MEIGRDKKFMSQFLDETLVLDLICTNFWTHKTLVLS